MLERVTSDEKAGLESDVALSNQRFLSNIAVKRSADPWPCIRPQLLVQVYEIKEENMPLGDAPLTAAVPLVNVIKT
jgi:hypothetical protein